MINDQTVYLCDDDQGVRDGLSYLLEENGYKVRCFASGPELLAAVDKMTAPVRGMFILDLNMEPMRGDALHDQLRARGLEHRTPVIFLSEKGTIAISVNAIKKGAIDFVEKPCADDSLIVKIREALELERQWQRQATRSDFLHSLWESLAPQQRRIARLKETGELNKVISRKMNIHERTVEEHWVKVRDKLGVDSAAELATTLAEIRTCGIDTSGPDDE